MTLGRGTMGHQNNRWDLGAQLPQPCCDFYGFLWYSYGIKSVGETLQKQNVSGYRKKCNICIFNKKNEQLLTVFTHQGSLALHP